MTKYPGSIDTDVEIQAVVDGVTENSSEIINNIRSAVLAIEKAVGLDPQGTESSLSDRVAIALNPNGTLTSTVLASSGLVSLPVTNAQIGTSAAITETKLNLDFKTQELNNGITSNDVDIAALQKSLADEVLKLANHINGVDNRHVSNHIDHSLIDGYSGGIGSTVESALNYIWGEVQAHKVGTVIREHYASAIEYLPANAVPGVTPVITSTNVQGAIGDMEVSVLESLREHSDAAHSDGVSNDGYTLLAGQALSNDASLKLTRYQPSAGRDIMKVGLINSPTVKSRGFSPTGINASSNSIDIEVTTGTNTRTLSITNLDSVAYPAGNSRVTLIGLVDFFNARFADTASANHFPVSAFASNDGEIVLQHNIARSDSSITIKSPGVNSAIAALGFSDLVDKVINYKELYKLVVNGEIYTELATTIDGYTTNLLPSDLSIIDLGVITGSNGLGINAHSLIHIYNHVDSTGGGTYKVSTTPSASSTEVQLSEQVPAGGFNFIIYQDTFDISLLSAGSGLTMDLFIDNSRALVASSRCRVSVIGSLAGIKIVEVSQDFRGATYSIAASTSGSEISMTLQESGGIIGTSVTFTPGFLGYLRVYSTDNKSYVTVFVHDVNPVTGTSTLLILDSEVTDSRLLLGTAHYNAASDITIPVDKRNVGLIGSESISTRFQEDILDRMTDDFHLSGVIRGFDIVSNTTTTVLLRGGFGYVAGKYIQREGVIVDIPTVNNTYNLVLQHDGSIDVFEEGTGSGDTYPVADILSHNDAILLAQIVVASNVISSTADGRLFINDIESKLQLTVDNREFGSGSFRSLEAATLYSKNAPNDTKPEITILSDLTISSALTIDSTTRIEIFGNLTLNANITMTSNAELICHGAFNSSAGKTISIGTDSKLTLNGGGTVSGDIDLGLRGELHIGAALTISGSSILSGSDSIITGSVHRPIISFSDDVGIKVSDGSCAISDLIFEMSSVASPSFAIIELLDGTSKFSVDNCDFSQTGVVSDTNWVDPINDLPRQGIYAKAGTLIDLISINRCKFNNFLYGVSILRENTRASITNSSFSNSLFGFYSTHTSTSLVEISNTEFFEIKNVMIAFDGKDLRILGCLFHDEFDVASPVQIIALLGNVANAYTSFTSNYIYDITVTTGLGLGAQNGTGVLANNLFRGCTSTAYLIQSGAGSKIGISDNHIVDHIGSVFRGADVNMSGNIVVVDNTNGVNTIIDHQTDTSGTSSVFDGNSFIFTDTVGINDTELIFTTSIIADNYISAGKILINPTSSNDSTLKISNNVIRLESAGVSVDFKGGIASITDNDIFVNGAFSPLILIEGSGAPTTRIIKASGNNLRSTGHSNGLELGSNGISANTIWNVNSNSVQNGTATGILIYADNVNCIANSIYGSGIDDIFISSQADTVSVFNNYVANGSINTVSSSPTAIVVGPNQNAISNISHSIFSGIIELDGYVESGWSVTSEYFRNIIGSAAKPIFLPLNLPVGVELVTVNTYISSVVSNTISVQIYSRDPTTAVLLGSALSGAGHGTNPLTITPSTHYVQDNASYFLKITSLTIGDKIYQSIANVKY